MLLVMRAPLFSLLPVFALMSMVSTAAFAAEKPGAKEPKEKPKQMNEVVSVDAKSITIYHSPKKETKYTVTDATKVVVDYKPAKIDNVKAGMTASVSHKPDSEEATSINARSAPKGGKK